MDPVTAALNALDSFNKFLCTPPGQILASKSEELIIKIFNLLHFHGSTKDSNPAAAETSK